MNFLIGFLNVMLIFALAFWVKKKFFLFASGLYWLVFLSKLLAAIGLGVLYQYYYSSGDTWLYFEWANQLATLAKSNFGAYMESMLANHDTSTVEHVLYVHDRSYLFVKLVSLFCFLTAGNYWLCAGYFALLSFFCSWYLYWQLSSISTEASRAAAISLFSFPSIVLWSSGLMKETLALSALYIITAIVVKSVRISKVSWQATGIVIISIIVGWLLKYYWMAIFLSAAIPSIILIVIQKTKPFTNRQLLGSWCLLFLLICGIASLAHPNFHLNRILEVITASHDQYQLTVKPENLIHFYMLQPNWWSVLMNSPWAIIAGLFAPFFWESHAILSAAASIENLVLLILVISFLFTKGQLKANFIFPLFFYSIALCVLLAISTPNLGTLSRYRIGFLPFLIFALAYRNSIFNYLYKRIPFFTN